MVITMLEKELNELSDETILTLYKSIVPSASIIETISKKMERQTNTTSTYSYKLVASDDGPPEGLSRIIDMLNNTIQ